MVKTAIKDGKYRYLLTRSWNKQKKSVLFIMLNPSVADEKDEDPTLKRCVGFAKKEGFGSLSIVNLFAHIASNFECLKVFKKVEVIGSKNDKHIKDSIEKHRLIVAAWGVKDIIYNRNKEILNRFFKDRKIYCLGVTNGGHPRHPLYLNKNTKLEEYKWDKKKFLKNS